MSWSKHFVNCISCKTTLFEHKGNGFCARCYSASKEVERLNVTSEQNLLTFIYKYIPVHDIPYQNPINKGIAIGLAQRNKRQQGRLEQKKL